MAAEAYSHAGDKLYICSTAQNDDLDASAFEALTYVQVSGVGNVGAYGLDTNILSHDTWDSLVKQKAKGMTDAGSPDVEVAGNDTDAGQIAMRVAGAPDMFDSFAFKITKQSGATDYLRGLVGGPTTSGGRNEDFALLTFKLGLNQVPLTVAASV